MIQEQPNKFLDAALEYASRGWHVFPLAPRGKIPLPGSHGFKDATTDEEKIKRWWAQTPDANIGLSCGQSRIVAIDLDASQDGVGTWQELIAKFGIDDGTLISLTGGGGQHILYLAPERIKIPSSTRRIGPGIDVKADGGYIVLPPSMHPNGKRYHWEVMHSPENTKLLAAPTKLLNLLLSQKPSRSMPRNWRGIIEGHRNDYLSRLAGGMRRKGMSQEQIEKSLLVENQGKCQPPLDEAEVKKIAASISRYSPEVKGTCKDFELTDLGNARRIEYLFGKDLRFCKTLDHWLIWNGEYWQADETDKIRTLAHDMSSILIKDAVDLKDTDRQAKLIRHALGSQSHSHINGMIEEAKALLPIIPAELDRDMHLFNCRNGTIDLRTAAIREQRREDLITKIAPIDYRHGADCPLWKAFLNDIMLGNEAMIRFLQRMIGYAMTGLTGEQVIFILYGTGANGKSTFVNIIRALFGDYALHTPTDTLMVKRDAGIPSDLARLKGARLVVASESDQGRRLSESLIKQLTGGDPISARELFGRWFEFVPNMKVWLVTNHKPIVRGTDLAIWRRIRLIPFNFVIRDDCKDMDLPAKLLEELPGILNWALEGCLDWQEKGLGMPSEIKDATGSYRLEMDLLGSFLSEQCVEGPELRVQVAELYSHYKSWCQENGEEPVSMNLFGRLLAERGYARFKETTRSKKVFYIGIGLPSVTGEGHRD